MTLIVDTGSILKLIEEPSDVSRAIAATLRSERSRPVLPQTVAAELDYMLNSRGGPAAGRRFLQDLAADRFEVPCLNATDFQAIAKLNERYRDLKVGLVDLSVVVMAARYKTLRLLTVDQRHFRLLRPLQGGTFTLLPFDEDTA